MSKYTIDIEYTQNNITKTQQASFTCEYWAIRTIQSAADEYDGVMLKNFKKISKGEINKFRRSNYAYELDFNSNEPIYFKINWP